MLRKEIKKCIPFVLAVGLVLGYTVPSMACTGLYVGSGYAQNGSTYFGRSEDLKNNNLKVFGVQEAKDWPEGTIYTDNDGFTMPMPAHTYRYSYIRDTKDFTPPPVDANKNEVGQAYGEAGINEKGVSVSATVSTKASKTALEKDPLIEGGITEVSIGSILLGISESARDGVEKLAGIIDKYGANENNSLMISDPNETWYFEIVSGHQYAAIKLPSNKVSAQPNITLLGAIDVNDTENVVVSPNLVKLAEDNGFLVKDETGKIDVALTYRGPIAQSAKVARNLDRYWMAGNYLNPGLFGNETLETLKADDSKVQLLYDADRKLATAEVLNVLKQRGIGTKYDHTKDSKIYPVGNENQMEVHVFEKRADQPLELTTIQWQGMADAPYTIYIPYYTALMNQVNPKYQVEAAKPFSDGSIHQLFNDLNEMGMNNYNENLEKGVREYLHLIQNSLIEQQPTLDAHMNKVLAEEGFDKAQAEANRTGIDISDQVYDLASKLRSEMKAYIDKKDFSKPFVASGFTEKKVPVYNLDPKQGGEISDSNNDSSNNAGVDKTKEKKVVKPESNGKSVNTGDTQNLWIYVGGAVAAVILVAVLILVKRKK